MVMVDLEKTLGFGFIWLIYVDLGFMDELC